MNKLILFSLGAVALSASPAMAQTVPATGTVQVNGSVASKCTMQGTASKTINLGELALATGQVASAFPNADTLTHSFTVVCTAPNPTIAVSSTKLTISGDAGTENGYTGTINYTSTLVADKADSTTSTLVYNSADANPASAALGAGARLKNAANNLTVTVSNGSTGAGQLLKAGTYGSAITITVTPA